MIDGERAQGRTAVVVSLDGHPIGLLALADRLRDEAPAALAERAGIASVRAGLLPEDEV
jgi:cation-transporting P-type ATPase J